MINPVELLMRPAYLFIYSFIHLFIYVFRESGIVVSFYSIIAQIVMCARLWGVN